MILIKKAEDEIFCPRKGSWLNLMTGIAKNVAKKKLADNRKKSALSFDEQLERPKPGSLRSIESAVGRFDAKIIESLIDLFLKMDETDQIITKSRFDWFAGPNYIKETLENLRMIRTYYGISDMDKEQIQETIRRLERI